MEKKELMQHILADTLDAYVGVYSKLRSIINIMGDCKKNTVYDMIVGKQYLAKNIVDFVDKYSTKGIDPDMMLKAVAVDVEYSSYYYNNPLNGPYLMHLNIAFLGNPEDILKKSVTDAEKKILNNLKVFYDTPRLNTDLEVIRRLNSDLKYLKHGYNIVYIPVWSFDAKAFLSDDFFLRGLKCGITSLNLTYNRIDD